MSADLPLTWRRPGERLPESPACAICGVSLRETFGWCSGCRLAFCFPCGRRHFCTPTCQAKGCIAGLCVRLVEHGVMAETWGLPD